MCTEYVELEIVTVGNDATTTIRRFPKNISVGDLKKRLELIVGIPSQDVTLELCSSEGDTKPIRLLCNQTVLNSLPMANGMVLKAINERHEVSDEQETVPAFHLTDEQYDKRPVNLKKWLKEQKRNIATDEDYVKLSKEIANKFRVGQRCKVEVSGRGTQKSGCIQFIGEVHFKPGTWIGVQYDDPVGKNDGSIDGRRYFECSQNYGAFVKPACVEAEVEEI